MYLEESLRDEAERLFAMRYPQAQVNMKVEAPKPSVHIPEKVQQTDIHVHIIPVEQEPQKEPSVDEKCPLCDKPYEEKKCSKKHMHCMTNRKYTDDHIKNCVYDSYYDAHIPISEQKSTANYLMVEQMRKEIREYQLHHRSGDNSTYKELEVFITKVSLF